MVDDDGWIRTLMDEAENERMHLMTFVEIARPTAFERLVVLLAQGAFYIGYFGLYLASRRTAHRLVGYFEEEAVLSYTLYWTNWKAAACPIRRRQPSPSTTGSWPTAPGWPMSCVRFGPTRPCTATSTTGLPARSPTRQRVRADREHISNSFAGPVAGAGRTRA
jgi:hypothetical protein